MPFLGAAAVPIASSIGGILSNAFGNSGKQGGQASTGASTTTQNQNITEHVKATELPEITAFRNTLFPAFGQALADAQSPLFSENAKAAFLSNINDQSGNAVNAISQNLARRGALNSGALGSAFTDVELSRNRDITDFLTQLPLLERNAKFGALTPLLQLGLGFAGTGPQDVTSTRTGTTTSDTQSTGNVNVNGPGFLRSLAQEAGSASALGNSNSLLNLLLSGRFGGGNNVDPVGQALNYDPRNPAIDPNDPLAAVLGLGRS